MTQSEKLYQELKLIDQSVFKVCGLALTRVETELESQVYFAHNFKLDEQKVKFRMAKITPKKTGQFVAIWKRNNKGTTEPFDVSDNIDVYLIATRKGRQFGLFIFPKAVLYEHGIISSKTTEGKRGIRVYPPWDPTTSRQAHKTQLWQTRYFLELSQDKPINLKRAKDLLVLGKHTDAG